MISILDYGAGNLRSVEKAIHFLGYEPVITRDKDVLLHSDKVILPGVGSFGDAMAAIRTYQLEQVIFDVIEKNIPFLGICLGLQLMYEESEESKGVTGLGVLKGKIKHFPPQTGFKIPQMGWNQINIQKKEGIFQGLNDPYVYFVHSYYLDAKDKEEVAATCEYSISFDAAIEKDNIALCQFHPEKSGDAGLQILKNFIQ